MNKEVESILQALERQEETFCLPEGTEGYENVWTPDGYIRLWQVPRSSGELLYALALASNARSILELGTSAGYSSIWLGMAAKVNGGSVKSIDIAKGKVEMATKNLLAAGLSDTVEVIHGEISPLLDTMDQCFDFVFLDADKSNYFLYMKKMERMLSENCVIVADNVSDYGNLMRDFIGYVEENPAYNSVKLDIDHGLLVSRFMPPSQAVDADRAITSNKVLNFK